MTNRDRIVYTLNATSYLNVLGHLARDWDRYPRPTNNGR